MSTVEQIPLVDLRAQHAALRREIDAALASVIASTRFVNGPQVAEFEAEFAEFCGARFAVGTASGTSALHLALRACGVGPGDEVITAVNTFTATAEAILHCGATPVFVDVQPNTLLIDPEFVAAAVSPRTRAVVPVHLFGQMAPLAALEVIAARHGLDIVADAAQAHGAAQDGRGAGAAGRAAMFSFYPGKNLGAYGDAGALATDDAAVAESVRLLRDHGRRAKYEHEVVGFGERLDTLQAAVLLAKLPRLRGWNAARAQIAAQYDAQLAGLPVRPVATAPGNSHVYHLYVIRTARRDDLRAYLSERGIATGVHYPTPLHLQAAYARLGYRRGQFPHAERAATEIVSLPIYPEMTPEQVTRVCDAIRGFFAA
ncbi:MAG: DegT/DnrJ/EryC1/StrS family aminotransferase [Anaerolineales bacterium]